MTKEETKKLLANTKVYVGEHRKKVIDKLFDLGFDKLNSSELMCGLENPEFIYINNANGFVGGESLDVFFSDRSKQISMSEILDIQIDTEFKDGDVLSSSYGCTFIFNGKYDKKGRPFYYVGLNISGRLVFSQGAFFTSDPFNLATEEKSSNLFKALSDDGKRWNAEKKCVENLPNEFKPFDKVLCRDRNDQNWTCDLYSHKDDDLYMTIGCYYKQCIPYEGNESLLGTSLPY